ncbi:hypothetical protein [Pigmentiphaga sp. NML080357]|uniref:hypothetical protein n=1 Tax=Pigmentiphaga sp. NML080357 TaxID=2008675 RepID=UPI00118535EF|nr:hypothetical protein [Pigmentiphaga sp. NML080357]
MHAPAAGARRPFGPRLAGLLRRWLPAVCLAACGAVSPLAASAADEAQPAPARTFSSIEEAQAAADAAKAETDRLKQQYDVEAAECMSKFFANRCVEKARIERNENVMRSDAARREAELYIRREQARLRHEERDRENAERDARNARRAEEAANRPPRQAAEPEPAAPRPAGPGGELPAPQPRPPRDVDDPAVRARNRADFERKQAEAREYAEKQARQREEAEAKRARRRAEREEEAERLKARQQEEGAQAPAGNR